ncbi:hypothetical protein [Myroides odoratus]|uniref:Lipoprotein n=1 Tax=Myroides odoratus TaxID=256 RepID=A0A9Q7EAI8_MYROD|nr:hypothetical protein [Myroides odoratus]EHQ41891.1 hypothetical protein Myrod_1057 [Myroides odoratus DSM 2801]EKB09103.1 hypothetical protein HMPREF9716_00387 [Myroides odoratus CIP 103059]QQT99284.1 hypothetical protein I6I88_13885 [Myroides odoratus]WQD58517.1 hypothetical protein U0010_05075 [Myroides odoratus]STZ29152.1 Uncharacterised protein [Myroides odoratus]
MNRLFYYFSMILVGLSVMGCKDKTPSPTSSEVETSTPVDQVKIDTAIDEYELISQETIDKLNEAIKREKLTSVEGIMRFYAPEDKEAEGKYSYDITVLQMSNSSLTLITLTEEGINDDSMQAKKVVMTIKAKDGHNQVTQIKQSYKCWEGRGHTNWNASHCS